MPRYLAGFQQVTASISSYFTDGNTESLGEEAVHLMSYAKISQNWGYIIIQS